MDTEPTYICISIVPQLQRNNRITNDDKEAKLFAEPPHTCLPPDDDDGKGKFRTAAGGKVASRLDDERRQQQQIEKSRVPQTVYNLFIELFGTT